MPAGITRAVGLKLALIAMLNSQTAMMAAKLAATTCQRGVVPLVSAAAAVRPGWVPSRSGVRTCTSAIVLAPSIVLSGRECLGTRGRASRGGTTWQHATIEALVGVPADTAGWCQSSHALLIQPRGCPWGLQTRCRRGPAGPANGGQI